MLLDGALRPTLLAPMRPALIIATLVLLLLASACQREQWESFKERAEPELITEINIAVAEVEDYRAQKRDLLTTRTREINGAFGWPPRQTQLNAIDTDLHVVEIVSAAARERAQMALLALISRYPNSPSRQQAENLVLGEECATIQRLHDERARIAADLEDPPEVSGDSPVEFSLSMRRLDQQRLRALEEEVGARLTTLSSRFPESQRVKEVDRAIVFPRYQDLNGALSRMPAANGDDVEIDPDDAADLLAALAELKRLYPRSAWTREAERKVSPLTAKRDLRDLWGWPVVIFLFFGLLLLTELGRCLGAFRRRGPQVEKQQVLRARSVETDMRTRAAEGEQGDDADDDAADPRAGKPAFRFESPLPQRFRLPLVQSSRQLAQVDIEIEESDERAGAATHAARVPSADDAAVDADRGSAESDPDGQPASDAAGDVDPAAEQP